MKMAQAAVDFYIQEEQNEQNEQNEHLQEEISAVKELNQDIFLNDKAIKIDNNSKVKARNFLTNVSYNRITSADYKNSNFVIDCFTFLIVYLNPFYLERKFESVLERDFVNVLWNYLVPESLYQFINTDENMKILNRIMIKHHDGKKIISKFIEKDSGHLATLSAFLSKNAILYQYLFGNLFPKCFSRVNDYGIAAKTLFNKYYHSFNLQKNVLDFVKKQEQIEQIEQIEQKLSESDDSPMNMTTLYDVENDENDDDIVNQASENKENIDPKPKTKTKSKSTPKRKTNEEKVKKREAKKRKLLEQLNENTEKMLKIKGKSNK